MEPAAVVFAILFFVVVVTIFMGVRLVPQGFEFVVQRLGKYHSTLKPGLNFIIPYVTEIDRVVNLSVIRAIACAVERLLLRQSQARTGCTTNEAETQAADHQGFR